MLLRRQARRRPWQLELRTIYEGVFISITRTMDVVTFSMVFTGGTECTVKFFLRSLSAIFAISSVCLRKSVYNAELVFYLFVVCNSTFHDSYDVSKYLGSFMNLQNYFRVTSLKRKVLSEGYSQPMLQAR
jgi:hypothetical protein